MIMALTVRECPQPPRLSLPGISIIQRWPFGRTPMEWFVDNQLIVCFRSSRSCNVCNMPIQANRIQRTCRTQSFPLEVHYSTTPCMWCARMINHLECLLLRRGIILRRIGILIYSTRASVMAGTFSGNPFHMLGGLLQKKITVWTLC